MSKAKKLLETIEGILEGKMLTGVLKELSDYAKAVAEDNNVSCSIDTSPIAADLELRRDGSNWIKISAKFPDAYYVTVVYVIDGRREVEKDVPISYVKGLISQIFGKKRK